jgi:hypothetical protein
MINYIPTSLPNSAAKAQKVKLYFIQQLRRTVNGEWLYVFVDTVSINTGADSLEAANKVLAKRFYTKGFTGAYKVVSADVYV